MSWSYKDYYSEVHVRLPNKAVKLFEEIANSKCQDCLVDLFDSEIKRDNYTELGAEWVQWHARPAVEETLDDLADMGYSIAFLRFGESYDDWDIWHFSGNSAEDEVPAFPKRLVWQWRGEY